MVSLLFSKLIFSFSASTPPTTFVVLQFFQELFWRGGCVGGHVGTTQRGDPDDKEDPPPLHSPPPLRQDDGFKPGVETGDGQIFGEELGGKLYDSVD